MEELLNKYYDYFIKGDFHDKENIDNDSGFYGFYKMIINEYDLSKDSQMKIDMEEFFNFFDKVDMFGFRIKGTYSTSGLCTEESSKRRFERYNKASFDWFSPSPYMCKNSVFVYSYSERRVNEPFCKAYLSIKPDKYLSVIIKLQDFINSFYLNHANEKIGQYKFRNVPSNDAIVIRFACEEHYNEFLQYLEQNKEIMESFDTPSPFMPQDNYGLSIIADDGGSYNYFVTKIIWDYMFYCKNNNSNVSINGIVEFINNYDYSKDKMINTNNEETIIKYKTILSGKLLSVPDEELLPIIIGSKGKSLK